ncbi:MAG: preprotein translocase subunit YajC [Anaerolineae bacterium]
MPDQQWGFWVILIVAMGVFVFLPQIMARRRRKKREEELQVGDSVMTIGGLLGELTYLDFDENLARLKLAEGVEVRILPGAISGRRQVVPESSPDETPGDASET